MSVPLIPAGVEVPALYAAEGQGDSALVVAHLFHPLTDWHWYVLEVDPADGRAFGLVDGWALEFGYFDLNELEANDVAADAAWQPRRIGDVKRDCEIKRTFE